MRLSYTQIFINICVGCRLIVEVNIWRKCVRNKSLVMMPDNNHHVNTRTGQTTFNYIHRDLCWFGMKPMPKMNQCDVWKTSHEENNIIKPYTHLIQYLEKDPKTTTKKIAAILISGATWIFPSCLTYEIFSLSLGRRFSFSSSYRDTFVGVCTVCVCVWLPHCMGVDNYHTMQWALMCDVCDG